MRRTSFLWLVAFRVVESVRSEERVGAFQILVRERSAERVIDRCAARLRALRRSTTLFDEPCKVYIEHAIRVPESFEAAALLNYSIDIRPKVTVYSPIPEQAALEKDFAIYGPRISEKGTADKPFLSFRRKTAAKVG